MENTIDIILSPLLRSSVMDAEDAAFNDGIRAATEALGFDNIRREINETVNKLIQIETLRSNAKKLKENYDAFLASLKIEEGGEIDESLYDYIMNGGDCEDLTRILDSL